MSLKLYPSVYITNLSFLTIYLEYSSYMGIVSLCTDVSIIPLIPLKLKSRNSSNRLRISRPELNCIEGPKYIRMAIYSLTSLLIFFLLSSYWVITNISWFYSIAVFISSITILLRNILFLSRMILKHHTENSGGITAFSIIF